jgi:protein-S-isoprenylcysteine O-methyltransferase Ste14
MSTHVMVSPAKKDHPGVYIPPPIIYALIFITGMLLQKLFPLNNAFFFSTTAKIAGIFFIIIAVLLLVNSLYRFIITRNTVVTIKPASSLQTTGIYSLTRNPMYIGLAAVYTALSFLLGNWWNFILLPLLIVIVQAYIIRREEKYLERTFGDAYIHYKKRVRRWL